MFQGNYLKSSMILKVIHQFQTELSFVKSNEIIDEKHENTIIYPNIC